MKLIIKQVKSCRECEDHFSPGSQHDEACCGFNTSRIEYIKNPDIVDPNCPLPKLNGGDFNFIIKPKPGDLRVWWIPQVPMKPFYVPVLTGTILEAKHILDILAFYDQFQYQNRIKPDYSNAGGLQIYELDSDGEGHPGWTDWHSDEGDGIDEVDYEGNPLE